MKIVIDNNCGFCNKLWSIVNPVIWSIRNREKTIFISYDLNFKYFPKLFFNRHFWFPLIYVYHSIGYRVVTRLQNKLEKIKQENHHLANSIWQGWDTRYKEISEDEKIILRKVFKPSKKVLSKIENRFKKEREFNDIIIGIHIRLGDYLYYEGGKYFFTIDEYKDVMRKLIRKFGRRVKFFISSNEYINPEDFSEFRFFYFGGKAIVDLYSLSQCDYIIGPPSTFSMWASLYGGNLLSFIIQKEQETFLFRPINRNISLEELETNNG